MTLALLRSQTDDRLVALAREGHERAFEAIVKRYRRPLLNDCRRMVPPALAEDVLQQALISAWTALRRGDDVRDLRSWLFRIARNASISSLRRTGHDGVMLLGTLAAAPSPHEEAERRALVLETLETIAELPERQREALLRIAVQGSSQDEVADAMGVSRIAVRQLVHRARTSLRAAASAFVPFPVLTWLASAGTADEPIGLRVARLVAGAGGGGAAGALVKAGAVAGVAATAVVSAPMLAERHPPRPAVQAVVATATPAAARTAKPPAGRARAVTVTAPAKRSAGGTRGASGSGGASGRGESPRRRPVRDEARVPQRSGGGRDASDDRDRRETRGERGPGGDSPGGGDDRGAAREIPVADDGGATTGGDDRGSGGGEAVPSEDRAPSTGGDDGDRGGDGSERGDGG